MLDRLLRRQEQAQHVEVEHPVEMLGGHFLQRGELVNAGVVDQDVEPPERPLGLGKQSLNIGLVGHIGLHGHGLPAVGGDRGHDAFGGPLLEA